MAAERSLSAKTSSPSRVPSRREATTTGMDATLLTSVMPMHNVTTPKMGGRLSLMRLGTRWALYAPASPPASRQPLSMMGPSMDPPVVSHDKGNTYPSMPRNMRRAKCQAETCTEKEAGIRGETGPQARPPGCCKALEMAGRRRQKEDAGAPVEGVTPASRKGDQAWLATSIWCSRALVMRAMRAASPRASTLRRRRGSVLEGRRLKRQSLKLRERPSRRLSSRACGA